MAILSIVHPATAAAWAAATSRTGQLTALASALGDGWVARIEGTGGVLRRTQTYAALTLSGSPPQLVVGSPVTDTPSSEGDVVRVVFRTSGGTDILTSDAQSGSGPASIDFATGGIRTLCRPTLAGVVFTGSLALPANELPAWLAAANPAVNEWVEISGTSGAGGALIDAFSGMAVAGTQVVIAAAGGHSAGLDNRVVSLDLAAEAPGWIPRMESSTSTTQDTAYYPDGKPASRHTYHSIHTIAGNKVLLGGLRFTFNGSVSFDTMDAFDLDTNTWDGVVPGSPGTSGSGYTNLTPSGYYLTAQDGNGDLWSFLHTTGAVAKYTVATNTWSTPIASPVSPSVRYPWAWDSLRGQFFGLAWADGEGFGTGLRAVRQNGTTQTAITFNASAALTDLINDAPEYCAMVYVPEVDKFYFYEGYSTRAGRVYVITPNAGTVWDVSILSTTGAAVTACPGTKGTNYSGVQNRFQRVTLGSMKGIVLLPRASSNLFFLRTS